jgi:hypothetical protein
VRANREHFPHPNPKIHKQKKPFPDLLVYFQEEITLPWHQYCIKNLAKLTIEFARNQLISKIIPSAFEASSITSIEQGDEESLNNDKERRKGRG